MAGKRTAVTDLNHMNWDQEDEPEEAGTFKKASNSVLEKRVIKTARRRNPISSASSNVEGASKGLFGSFTGFAKTTPASTAFGFLNNLSKTQAEPPKSNGLNSGPSKINQSNSSHASLMFKAPEPNQQSTDKEDEYYAKLKGLNESVSNWIKKHVDANPFLNLKPIFKDYEKYFDELEKLRTEKPLEDKNKVQSNVFSAGNKILSPSTEKELSSFVFKPTEKSNKNSDTFIPSVPQFSFGTDVDKKDVSNIQSSVGATQVTETPSLNLLATDAKNDVTKENPQFSFGTATSTATFNFGSTVKSSSGFSFNGSNTAPFTFKNVQSNPSSNPDKEDKQKEGDDEDEPPKVEFTPVVEDGHIYMIRCKVFVKKDNNFGDRGVGNLYLKPVPSSEKVQLIVRADTNLGNLLCNFILSDSIPTKRMGKRDVMLVCLPTPESKPPPVPVLLRVKTAEEADDLFRVLEKYKK